VTKAEGAAALIGYKLCLVFLLGLERHTSGPPHCSASVWSCCCSSVAALLQLLHALLSRCSLSASVWSCCCSSVAALLQNRSPHSALLCARVRALAGTPPISIEIACIQKTKPLFTFSFSWVPLSSCRRPCRRLCLLRPLRLL
jgi:hypothetical protein